MRRIAAVLLGILLTAGCHSAAPRRSVSPVSPAQVVPATDPPAPASPTSASDHGLPARLRGTEWTVLPTSENVVAVTFDAGANNAGVAAILHTLDQEGVAGTFFLTGAWTDLYPGQAREIAASYPVGNHTYDHPYLTHLSDQDVLGQVTRAGERIRGTTQRDDRPLFRFPYGDSDARTIDLVNGLGYVGIRWTVDTAGWKGTSGGESVERVVQRVLDALRPGAIVLMHVGSNPEDGSTLDADALPRLIAGIRARGYEFVTVDRYV